MSLAQKGRRPSHATTIASIQTHRHSTLTHDHIEKIRVANNGHEVPLERRLRIGQAQKGKPRQEWTPEAIVARKEKEAYVEANLNAAGIFDKDAIWQYILLERRRVGISRQRTRRLKKSFSKAVDLLTKMGT